MYPEVSQLYHTNQKQYSWHSSCKIYMDCTETFSSLTNHKDNKTFSRVLKLKTNKIWPQGGQVCMWNCPSMLCQQMKSLRCLIKLIKLMKKNLTTLRLKSWFSIHSNRNRWQLWNINTVLIAWYTNNTKVITLP